MSPSQTASRPRRSPIIRLGNAIGGLFMLVGGPVAGYFLLNIVLEARRSINWPVVPGVIQDSHVENRSVLNHNAFCAVLTYTYRVGPSDFTGSRIRTSDGELPTADLASRELRGLSIGTSVAVYYDPAAPGSSVLKPGARWQEYALLIVPFVMLGMGFKACNAALNQR